MKTIQKLLVFGVAVGFLLTLNLKTAVAEEKGEIYFLKGLYYEYYQVEEGAKILGLSTKSSFFNHSNGVSSLKPAFPDDPELLTGVKLIVMANIDSDALGFRGRQLLEKAVKENGIGLLIFGEYLAFGGGGYQKSLIEKMLPVTLPGIYDLEKTSPPLVLTPASPDGPFKNLSWPDKPSVLWYHRLASQPDGEILVKMGNEPFLVIRPYGSGKVGVLTGTVLGKKEGSTLPFWEWKDLPRFMAETMNLLIKK